MLYKYLKYLFCVVMSTYFTPTEKNSTEVSLPIQYLQGSEVLPHFSSEHTTSIVNLNDCCQNLCQGTLLDSNTVLTDYSCVESIDSLGVVFHRHNLTRPFYEEGSMLREVFNIVHDYNIALLKLKEKVSYQAAEVQFLLDSPSLGSLVTWGNSLILRGYSGLILKKCGRKYLCLERDVSGIKNVTQGTALMLDFSNIVIGIFTKNDRFYLLESSKKLLSLN